MEAYEYQISKIFEKKKNDLISCNIKEHREIVQLKIVEHANYEIKMFLIDFKGMSSKQDFFEKIKLKKDNGVLIKIIYSEEDMEIERFSRIGIETKKINKELELLFDLELSFMTGDNASYCMKRENPKLFSHAYANSIEETQRYLLLFEEIWKR